MEQAVRVFVTGAGALLGQGIIRALKASSLQTYLIAVDPSPLSAGLYWADEAHPVPMARDSHYLSRVCELLEATRPDVVLMGTDVELEIFAKHRAELEAIYQTHILVSDPRVIAIADDKYLTYGFLRDNGFPFPDSCLPDEVDELVERSGFPLVVKPRIGARSVGVYVVNNRDELHEALLTGTNLVVQECISDAGREYTAGALCFDGGCSAAIVMRRDLRDGNTYRAYAEPYPRLTKWVRKLTESLKPHGPVNFQFRLDSHGQPKVFEINARFSGTTPLRRYAGFNEVEMCIRKVLEGIEIQQPDIEPITIMRHWSETVIRPEQLAWENESP